MDAKPLSLAATLNSPEVDYYTIPQYQRPYTWEKDNFETLWEDLCEAYTECTTAKQEGRPVEYYFLGPMVFVKNTAKKSYDIIDGQQRTTTFHILLWYLYRRITDEIEKQRILLLLTFLGRETKLRVSAKDAATFLHIKESDAEPSGTSKMVDCARYFRSKVALLSDPNSFSEFLRDHTQFIVIVADDYNKAWDLFIGINGKGEPLNPTDLVKAFVCGKTDVGDDAGRIWEEKILRLKEDSTSYLLFLTRLKAKKFVSENSLFKEISKQFPATIKTLDIAQNSDIYFAFWRQAIDEIGNDVNGLTMSLESRRALRTLRALQRRDVTTLILQYAESFDLKSIFEESFLTLLASYQVRMAMSRKRSRERKFVTDFKDIVFASKNGVLDDDSTKGRTVVEKTKALKLIETVLKNDAPDDATFETLIRIADYGNGTSRIILQQYEEGMRGDKMITGYQLEHLMPQTGTDYWFEVAGTKDPEQYGKIVNSIGNLFVIDAETNNQVKNKPYKVKKSFYHEYLKDWSIARVTSDKDEWTPNDIGARSEDIATWAKNHWRL